MGKNKGATQEISDEKSERRTVKEGTDAVLAYVKANPNRADVDSIAVGTGMKAPTVKRYADMLEFAGILEGHSCKKFYSVTKA